MVDRLAILQLTHHFRLVGCYINAKVSESLLNCIYCGERRDVLFVTKQNSNVHKKNPTITLIKHSSLGQNMLSRRQPENLWRNIDRIVGITDEILSSAGDCEKGGFL